MHDYATLSVLVTPISFCADIRLRHTYVPNPRIRSNCCGENPLKNYQQLAVRKILLQKAIYREGKKCVPSISCRTDASYCRHSGLSNSTVSSRFSRRVL